MRLHSLCCCVGAADSHNTPALSLQAVLTEYIESVRKPTLIMLQSPWPAHRLTSHLPALNDFPIRMFGL